MYILSVWFSHSFLSANKIASFSTGLKKKPTTIDISADGVQYKEQSCDL